MISNGRRRREKRTRCSARLHFRLPQIFLFFFVNKFVKICCFFPHRSKWRNTFFFEVIDIRWNRPRIVLDVFFIICCFSAVFSRVNLCSPLLFSLFIIFFFSLSSIKSTTNCIGCFLYRLLFLCRFFLRVNLCTLLLKLFLYVFFYHLLEYLL